MDTTAQTSRTFTFADDETISLHLTNHSGDVVVHHDADPGTAEVALHADTALDFEPVTATCRRGRVSVEVPPLLSPDGGKGFAFSLGRITIGVGHSSVDVEVHVPPGADVSVSTKQGDVTLHGLSGTSEVRSGSGDVRVEESGRLRASTGSGDVAVGRCSGGSVTSGSGDIVVDSSTGDEALEVRTGTGDVSLPDNRGDVTVATGSGDIVASHARGSLTARTGTGDVNVAVPRGIPVWLDLTSGMGDVRRLVEGVGAPTEGQEHLSVAVRTGTGDITVHH